MWGKVSQSGNIDWKAFLLLELFLLISQSLVPWGHCWNGDKAAGEQFSQHHVGGLAWLVSI